MDKNFPDSVQEEPFLPVHVVGVEFNLDRFSFESVCKRIPNLYISSLKMEAIIYSTTLRPPARTHVVTF
jgi:hypothetical protein